MTTNAAPNHRPEGQVGLRGVLLCCIGLVWHGDGIWAHNFPPAAASATHPLTVSLTFDDGTADQMTAQRLLKKHGMVGTFYINSSFIGSARDT